MPVYSSSKKYFFCLPCRLFSPTIGNGSQMNQLSRTSTESCDAGKKWKKLWERLSVHEQSLSHKKYYLAWRELERRISTDAGINILSDHSLSSEAARWKLLLERIIDAVQFLGERGLAFRGYSQQIGD